MPTSLPKCGSEQGSGKCFSGLRGFFGGIRWVGGATGAVGTSLGLRVGEQHMAKELPAVADSETSVLLTRCTSLLDKQSEK